MRKKKNCLGAQKTSDIQGQSYQFQKPQQLSRSLPSPKKRNLKTASCQQIQHKSFQHQSNRVVNDNLVSSLNPKRTSMDLNSFIQVFRKKIRQTTIARQFQNSLQKFTSLSCNRTVNYSRQKGGFVGSYKKQNELLVQNNRIDNKIKKIIISDLEYKDRKLNTKLTLNQDSIERVMSNKQTSLQRSKDSKGQKSRQLSRSRIVTYSYDQNQDPEHNTISFSKARLESQDYKQNPEKYDFNETSNFHPVRQNVVVQNSNKFEVIFTNRRLQTITSYQRPNLMYNLSLYRKKHSYNVLRKSKKNIHNTSGESKNQEK